MHKNNEDPFDQIKLQQTAEVIHTLTAADVDAFVQMTGDHNPLHLDPDFASRTSLTRPVVHGMLSASFISTLIGMALPGHGALWLSQSINFLAPAYVGDRLTVRGVVRQISPATRLIVLDLSISNQNDEVIINGEASVMLPKLNSPEARVNNQVTFITGGGRGIGAAVARRLASTGRPIAVAYHTGKQQAEAVVETITSAGGQALAVCVDLRDANMVAQVVGDVQERLGPIDALVHSAAPPNPVRSFLDQEPSALREQMEIQVYGAEHCCRVLLPGMLERGTGSIVFIGSIAAEGQPPSMQSDYVVAKSALSALARCLATEYGPKGIRVNVVAPGMTTTDRINSLPEKARLLARMQAPLRRLAAVEDVAAAVAFLIGPDAHHITGITLPVCGGAVMD
jgi:3-oxoacyl-[acyl-carrier protein] reductase